jgi:hypothetical protein
MPQVRYCMPFVIVVLILCISTTRVSGDEPNVGILRVDSFQVPKEVAPNSFFSAIVDVVYAIHGPENATIRAAIYRNDVDHSNPLWESDSQIVSAGGERIWNVSLASPSTEGYLKLTAYAYFLEQGAWRFYNNSINGPGFSQAIIRIASEANLDVALGTAGLPVTIDNQTMKTSDKGEVQIILSVGKTHVLSVPPILEFQNASRIVFEGWKDGNNQTQRRVTLDGDIRLVGSYKIQYLLQVNSPVSPRSDWYNVGSNVTLESPSLARTYWPLDLFGVTYRFVGWTGDITSQSRQINITINSPVTVEANFSVDYGPLIIPAIFAAGIAGSVVIALVKRRGNRKTATELKGQESASRCGKCGEAVDEDWAHCIRCGAVLGGGSESVEK